MCEQSWIKPTMFTVLHKDFSEQKAREKIAHNQDWVWVKAFAYSWSICNDKSVQIPCLYLYTTWTQASKWLFLLHDYLGLIYTHRNPILEKAPLELPCGKENTYFKVTRQEQKAILRKAAQGGAGWPCPVSEAPLPLQPLVGVTAPLHCKGRAIPKLGFLHPQFRDAAKKQSGDNFWWHDEAGLGSSERFIRGEMPLPGLLPTPGLTT